LDRYYTYLIQLQTLLPQKLIGTRFTFPLLCAWGGGHLSSADLYTSLFRILQISLDGVKVQGLFPTRLAFT